MRITLLAALAFCSLISIQSSVATERKIIPDHRITTHHQTKINGDKIRYTAHSGTQPVWDDNGDPIASLHYTYYEKDDVEDMAKRPLLISFNGGPGSASVWMHLAYTGPKVIKVDDEGFPIQPYGVKQNPYSVLDVADILYVNPVNTGYSRILENKDGKLPSKAKQKEQFFGVNADIAYLADWINTFVTRNNRWLSPKYLIGESYGTTRVSGLALELQNRQWMYLNGVILVSPTDIGIKRDGPVEAANRIPYFAATAWHHKQLPQTYQQLSLIELLDEVEHFTINELIPGITKGGFISSEEKTTLIKKMANYTGLSETFIAQNNLDIPNSAFWKELLRDQGLTLGRLDSRYLGIDKRDAGSRPDYWPELTAWLHSFTPAINYYLQQELNYKTDLKYNMFGPVHPWDRSNNRAGENLRQAMAQNPFLHVMIQSGYYDGATNYFDAKYTMWQLDPSGKMKQRLSFKGYKSGHMMYLRSEDLKSSNQHVRDFILNSQPNQAAQYKLN